MLFGGSWIPAEARWMDSPSHCDLFFFLGLVLRQHRWGEAAVREFNVASVACVDRTSHVLALKWRTGNWRTGKSRTNNPKSQKAENGGPDLGWSHVLALDRIFTPDRRRLMLGRDCDGNYDPFDWAYKRHVTFQVWRKAAVILMHISLISLWLNDHDY